MNKNEKLIVFEETQVWSCYAVEKQFLFKGFCYLIQLLYDLANFHIYRKVYV